MGRCRGREWQETSSKWSSCGASMVEMRGGRRRAERREKDGVRKGRGSRQGSERKRGVARND